MILHNILWWHQLTNHLRTCYSPLVFTILTPKIQISNLRLLCGTLHPIGFPKPGPYNSIHYSFAIGRRIRMGLCYPNSYIYMWNQVLVSIFTLARGNDTYPSTKKMEAIYCARVHMCLHRQTLPHPTTHNPLMKSRKRRKVTP